MFDNDLKEAEEYLRYSFEHCHRESEGNKRLILIYLIPGRFLNAKEGVQQASI